MEVRQEALYELEDVEIDRVDAVDRPATGRKWLIVKSEEEDEMMAIAKELEQRVSAALEKLADDARERGGLPLSPDAVAALNEVAALFGREQPFAPIEAAAQETEAAADGDSAADVPVAAAADEASEQTPDEVRNQEGYGYAYPDPSIWSAILDELRAIRMLLEKGAVAKAQPPASRQPEPETRVRQPGARRWGEGLFADVLFGS